MGAIVVAWSASAVDQVRAQTPADTAPAALQGRWNVVSVTSDGTELGFQPGTQLVIQGTRWEYVDPRTNIKQKSGTLRIDASAKPKRLDFIAPADERRPGRAFAFWISDGSPVRCIYELDGDTLTISWRNPGTGQQRPVEMDGGNQTVNVHKRAR